MNITTSFPEYLFGHYSLALWVITLFYCAPLAHTLMVFAQTCQWVFHSNYNYAEGGTPRADCVGFTRKVNWLQRMLVNLSLSVSNCAKSLCPLARVRTCMYSTVPLKVWFPDVLMWNPHSQSVSPLNIEHSRDFSWKGCKPLTSNVDLVSLYWQASVKEYF